MSDLEVGLAVWGTVASFIALFSSVYLVRSGRYVRQLQQVINNQREQYIQHCQEQNELMTVCKDDIDKLMRAIGKPQGE